MKILSMMAECSRDVSWSQTHYFEQALAKIATVKWAGYGHKLHVLGENLNDTVERVMPDADWVILYDRAQLRFKEAVVIPDKRVCRVAYVTSDIHWNPPLNAKRFNDRNWDAFLMQQNKTPLCIYRTQNRALVFKRIDPDYYVKHLNAPIFYLGKSINPDVFAPIDRPKKYDVSFLGAHHPRYYPIRDDIWRSLPLLAKRNNWRTLIRGVPPGLSLVSRNIDDLLKKGYYVGRKYAEALALSKSFIFDGGVGRGPVKKYFEGMACKTCCLSENPYTGDELHFQPGFNFVEISRSNWKDKLKYYLGHDGERETIAQRGYETIMKYHTDDIRARELVTFLEEHS